MKKVLIIEDNPNTLKYLEILVQEIDVNVDVFAFCNLTEAYKCLMEHTIDLFMVDIILDVRKPGDSSGLNFVDNIRGIKKYIFTPVIFITSLEDPKLYSYERLHCYGYIEKPFNPIQVKELVKQSLEFPGEIKPKILHFRKDGIIITVEREKIVYVESRSHILYIHINRGECLEIPYITIKKFLEMVDSNKFLQCSRNTIVNICYIEKVDVANRYIIMKNKMGTVDIGITFRTLVKGIFT